MTSHRFEIGSNIKYFGEDTKETVYLFHNGYDESIFLNGFNIARIDYLSTQVVGVYLENIQDALDLIQWTKDCEYVNRTEINNSPLIRLGVISKRTCEKSVPVYNLEYLLRFFKKYFMLSTKTNSTYYLFIHIKHEFKSCFNKLLVEWCRKRSLLLFNQTISLITGRVYGYFGELELVETSLLKISPVITVSTTINL